MKAKIHINTEDATSVSSDNKDYTFYLEKPITLNERSKVSLESIHDVIDPDGSTSTPNLTGLLHIGGLTPYVYNGTPTTYGWSWTGGKVQEMEVDLTDPNEAIVLASDGFTQITNFVGGRLKILIYNDTTTTFNSPQTLMVIAEVMDMGANFAVGQLIVIKKRISGVTYNGALNDPLFVVSSVKDSLIYQDGFFGYKEQVGSFNPIFYEYANEVNQIDANFTTGNVELGQGLIVKMKTNSNTPPDIEVDSIVSGGYGYDIGDIIYINKASFLPSSSGTTFDLPIKLNVATNASNPPTTRAYDEGLLTIGNMAIDYSTIPTSIYGTFSYVAEWSVDLNDATKCSVFRSNGGASVGTGAVLKFFTFKDYGTGGFPKTSVLAQITSFGKNYQAGDYIIINETAFPTGYIASGQSVSMRVDISAVSTSEIVDYPKGEITGLTLNSSYKGEVSTNTNYTHTPSTNNGQNTDFIWGSGNQYIELKQIVDGGVGFSVGDTFWIHKNDALPTKSTYFTPFQVEVTAITNTTTPPPNYPTSVFNPDIIQTISMSNILNDTRNIRKSDMTNDLVLYNFQQTLFAEEHVFTKYYFDGFLIPQNIIGFTLHFETSNNLGLNPTTSFILEIIIS